MTFTRMLDWLGGSPAEANAAFEAALDVEPPRQVPPELMSKEETRALLRQSLQAQGRDFSQMTAMPA